MAEALSVIEEPFVSIDTNCEPCLRQGLFKLEFLQANDSQK
jgi:hypothetical protein